MKKTNTLSLKKISIAFFEKFGKKEVIEKDKEILATQKSTPKEIRRGINMTEEQKKIAQKIKEDIFELNKDGYSIRMIASYYNNLYSIKNKKGEVLKEAISRETIRKILNNEEVSLKTIVGIIGDSDI